MRLQTIVYTSDMEGAIAWWEALLGTAPGYASDAWTVFGIGDATLALHGTDDRPPDGGMEVSMVVDLPLDDVVADIRSRGLEPATDIVDQPFGRQVVFRDPSGRPVALNEHH